MADKSLNGDNSKKYGIKIEVVPVSGPTDKDYKRGSNEAAQDHGTGITYELNRIAALGMSDIVVSGVSGEELKRRVGEDYRGEKEGVYKITLTKSGDSPSVIYREITPEGSMALFNKLKSAGDAGLEVNRGLRRGEIDIEQVNEQISKAIFDALGTLTPDPKAAAAAMANKQSR